MDAHGRWARLRSPSKTAWAAGYSFYVLREQEKGADWRLVRSSKFMQDSSAGRACWKKMGDSRMRGIPDLAAKNNQKAQVDARSAGPVDHAAARKGVSTSTPQFMPMELHKQQRCKSPGASAACGPNRWNATATSRPCAKLIYSGVHESRSDAR